MNFFQSVFSDDPDPSSPEPQSQNPESIPPNPSATIPAIASAWTFGSGLMKTLASKSESVIETYRRDLEEFSSGIKKETAVIREAAARAVKDLPTSLEAGAGLAQESLESVGQAIDDLGSTVTEIIAQGKDSMLAVDYSDTDSDVTDANINKKVSSRDDLQSLKPYTRLDAQIRTIQSDMSTYLKDPEDLVEYNEWKSGFKLDEKVGEIDDIMNGNDGVVGEIYREIVPARVDEDSFWSRYFYRAYKINKAEEARANLVRKAISGEEDEELSWDVDEDDYEENAESDLKIEEKESVEDSEKEGKKLDDEKVESRKGNQTELEVDNMEAKSDVKTASEGKTDRDSDISVVSSQPSPEEDGWDEIEDIGSSDESKDKVVSHGSPKRAELHKRLSVAQEEEEDLTWDIEDDDEPVQA
ncbi:BSD domain-containing protein 1-like isoform X1 [Cynara cardunculus var. scolymus]|uniref:BSD domain-containing protein n=1 Tax=Cynara cardunculus var. scolymus TaxID=59895 RepID=A0A103XDR5_CYNCS|nr:BSD domain-containing protein 1-like isoform X1 [Cynara cardunculus var. scolymus]KVH88883.1 hypothetical protein Ccrd_024899 [Cynara cardunculus var. scolymus]